MMCILQAVAALALQFRSLPTMVLLLLHGDPRAWVKANLYHQVDSGDNVYVGDFGENYRIQKFYSNGTFISKWGTPGTGDSQFINPVDLVADSSDNIYVADRGNRIQKFDSNGTFISKLGIPGTGDGEFNSPADLAADSSGNILVVDEGSNRIQKIVGIAEYRYLLPNES
jgi:6-bladed beta-propeller protein